MQLFVCVDYLMPFRAVAIEDVRSALLQPMRELADRPGAGAARERIGARLKRALADLPSASALVMVRAGCVPIRVRRRRRG